jgi:hypothetical protein
VELKYLGTLTDCPNQYLRALSRYQEATIKDALKYVRRKARKNGWDDAMVKAESEVTRTRIKKAYRPFFERFQGEVEEGEGNVVTVSS